MTLDYMQKSKLEYNMQNVTTVLEQEEKSLSTCENTHTQNLGDYTLHCVWIKLRVTV